MRATLILLLALSACAEAPETGVDPAPASVSAPVPGTTLGASVAGALVYVPAYSHVYSGDRQQQVDLAATLSIRNTDAQDSIRVTAVHYVGSRGEAIRSYLTAPRALGPYATVDFVVDQSDRSGGSGASFLVEWTADGPVASPVVEAVMINTTGQQGISFVTEGRVVAEAGP